MAMRVFFFIVTLSVDSSSVMSCFVLIGLSPLQIFLLLLRFDPGKISLKVLIYRIQRDHLFSVESLTHW